MPQKLSLLALALAAGCIDHLVLRTVASHATPASGSATSDASEKTLEDTSNIEIPPSAENEAKSETSLRLTP